VLESAAVGRSTRTLDPSEMHALVQTSANQRLPQRLIKVDHAGEHGAVCIYRAQAWVCRLTAPDLVPMLNAFRRHEEGHRALFARYLAEHKVQRCRSYHLCGIGGFTLGIITGAFGRSAVAATTVAVERVVLRHLNTQLHQLATLDAGAHAAVAAIVLEETEHHDTANLDLRQGKFWPRLIMPVVSGAAEAVIWLGLKL